MDELSYLRQMKRMISFRNVNILKETQKYTFLEKQNILPTECLLHHNLFNRNKEAILF